MATPIVTGPNYHVDFQGGQGIASVASYFAYAIDLDTNFTTLRDTVNTLIAEVKAITGPNALFGQDILFLDDASITTPTTTGRIGVNPAVVTINANPALLDIAPGTMALAGARTSVPTQQIGYVGAADPTVYVAMDINGVCSANAGPGTAIADIAVCNWDGAAFTTVTDLLETFIDGDEYFEMRTEPAWSPMNQTASAVQFKSAHRRMDGVSRLLGGFNTDSEGDALAPQVIGPGSAAAVFLAFGASGAAADVGTGFWRSAADEISIATAGTLRAVLDPTGNLDLPTNSRVRGLRTTNQSITTATPTLVDFNAADAFDITGWHDHASGTLADRQEFTVPAGAGGTYSIVGWYAWAAGTQAAGAASLVEITLNGTAIVERSEMDLYSGDVEAHSIASVLALAAGDVLRMRVTHNEGANHNLTGAALSIIKAA